MANLCYLINHNRSALFCLGKGLGDADMLACSSKQELAVFLAKEFREGFFSFSCEEELVGTANNIAARIEATIGIKDNQLIYEGSDLLEVTYGNYILVGSIYNQDEDVGKPYSNF